MYKLPSCAKALNSLELNGGPLSLSNCLGVPSVANIVFNFSLTEWNDVVVVLITSGYLVLLSMTILFIWVRTADMDLQIPLKRHPMVSQGSLLV